MCQSFPKCNTTWTISLLTGYEFKIDHCLVIRCGILIVFPYSYNSLLIFSRLNQIFYWFFSNICEKTNHHNRVNSNWKIRVDYFPSLIGLKSCDICVRWKHVGKWEREYGTKTITDRDHRWKDFIKLPWHILLNESSCWTIDNTHWSSQEESRYDYKIQVSINRS